MSEDITKEWRATEGQKSKALRLRIFAAVAWVIAIGTEIAGVVLLEKHTFDHGKLGLLVGLLVVIAVFAVAGSFLWKAANKNDPASQADRARFLFQNQLGAIITLIAFVPLVVLIFLDKDMDPKNKKIAGGVGAALAVLATLLGVSYHPPSVEKYTADMNACANEIKQGLPTKDCSPEVAQQAQDIARDSSAVTAATGGNDTVYWIAPEPGQTRSSTQHVFHLCSSVSDLRSKTVHSGTVTQAYSENAVRITKELTYEQRRCGFSAHGIPTPSGVSTP
jgi:hypothetical protein